MFTHSDQGSISIFRAEFEKIVLPTLKNLNGPILDVGCSTAMYKDIFKKRYIGMDLCNAEFPVNNDKDQFIVGNGYHIPFKENSIDFVFCTGVLEHTEHPEKIIAEISRVLREGKTVFISVPTPIGLRWESQPKYKGYNVEEFENMLKENKLIITNYKMGGGILAQIFHNLESSLANQKNATNTKEEFKRWDPRLKTDQFNSIIGIRRFMIYLISSLEIKSGLNNIHPQGIYVWAKKGT